MKSALLLLYGSMAVRAPREQLLPLLASEIVPRILRHYTSSGPELTYFAVSLLYHKWRGAGIRIGARVWAGGVEGHLGGS